MSDQHGGPPRGAFGPGHTVLAAPGFADEAPAAGAHAAIPPTTVRDPGFEGSAVPPPYGSAPSPPYASPYAPESPYASPYAAAPPVGVPPPPARGRSRARGQGPSLVVIGIVSFFVIGGGVTTAVVLTHESADDKPMPTVNVPAPTNVPADPAGAPTADPTAADPPPLPPPRPTYPGKTNPGFRPGPRPGPPPRPGPRYPTPAPRPPRR